MTDQVTAIVVTHPSGGRPEAVLNALSEQTHPVNVVVVGPTSAVAQLADWTTVEVDASTGFAEAVNTAVAGLSGDVTHVLICHDDAVPATNAVELMLSRFSESEVAAVGAKLVSADGQLLEVGASIDRFGTRRTGLEDGEFDHGQYDNADEALFCSSAFLMVRRSDWDQIGGFDAAFWPMYEDIDLGWRLRRSGRSVKVAADAVVVHGALMSSSRRRSAGPEFGAFGLRVTSERQRLKFLAVHFSASTLAIIIPQDVVRVISKLLRAAVARRFWELRATTDAVVGFLRELPRTIERRKNQPDPVVDDVTLFTLAGQRSMGGRRNERIGVVARTLEALESGAARASVAIKRPVNIAAVVLGLAAFTAVRSIFLGDGFVLGELRTPVAVSEAFRAWTSGWTPEGLSPVIPTGPGALLMSLLAVITRRPGFAEAAMLVLPIALIAAGALRVSTVLTVPANYRGWLAALAAVNPVTIRMLVSGEAGALVAAAAFPWMLAGVLAPFGEDLEPRERRGRVAGWALTWALPAVFAPAAIPVFLLSAGTIAVARSDDQLGHRRMRLILIGCVAAFLSALPGSLWWLSPHTPLLGQSGVVLEASFRRATLGVGAGIAVWAAAVIIAVAVLRPSRTGTSLLAVTALAWIGGVVGLFPVGVAAVTVGWCLLLLSVLVARRVEENVASANLGLRQVGALAVLVAVVLATGWSVVRNSTRGARPHTEAVVVSEDVAIGRVMWLRNEPNGQRRWFTDGFANNLKVFPAPVGPETAGIDAAVALASNGDLDRLGAVLAAANISHVVALDRDFEFLSTQVDLSTQSIQSRATVWKNEGWRGPSVEVNAVPRAILTPAGLTSAMERFEHLESTRADRQIEVENPSDNPAYVFGGRTWWGTGTPGFAGTVVDSETQTVKLPWQWTRFAWIISLAVLSLAFFVRLTASYLAGPDTPAVSSTPFGVRVLELPGYAVVGLAAPFIVAFALGMTISGFAADNPTARSLVCPSAGEDYPQQIAIVNPNPATVSVQVRSSIFAPTKTRRIPPYGRTTVDVGDGKPGLITATGGSVAAVTLLEAPTQTTSTAICTASVQGTAFFPEGGRAATRARERLRERIVISNPFGTTARASVRYYPDDGDTVAPPDYRDIVIPPGDVVLVDHEDQLPPQMGLSTEVTIWQGRAIAARRLTTEIETTLTTAVAPVSDGVAPRAVTDSARTQIVVMNPSRDPADLELSTVGGVGSLPRSEVGLDPRARTVVDLADVAPDAKFLVVRLSGKVAVPSETIVTSDDRDARSVLPLLRPRTEWILPAVEGRAVILTNPSNQAIRVKFRSLGEGDAPGDITVGPSKSIVVEPRTGAAFGFLLTSSRPIVAAAYGGAGAYPAVTLAR